MKHTRRTLLKLVSGALVTPWQVFAANSQPMLDVGCACGDVTADSAVIWTRANQDAMLLVDIDVRPDFETATRFKGAIGRAENDYNLHCTLTGLTPAQQYYYRVWAASESDPTQLSQPLHGQFKTAPTTAQAIRFCWSGDVVGQGYGIDKSRGGMGIFKTMRAHQPDFFVHSGDQIYADGPLQAEKLLEDGSVWQNLMTHAKSKVAETTQDFRENYYYNFLDQHFRAFYASVPVYQQWDDHEVHNNWYPTEVLTDARYQEKRVAVLAARAKQALFDCNPMRRQADAQQVYRQFSYGSLLDLFMVDLRSYRGPNTENRQAEPSDTTAYFGQAQLAWLKDALANSKASWKIICSDMPIGLIVRPWKTDLSENGANGDGPPLGREFEIADLLQFMKHHNIKNTHFITADVHYCASHHYQPEKAVFKDFLPFWEFVSGPLHAGTFGPNPLDNTFGPEAKFIGIPDGMKPNRPPSDGYQFFGQIDIDPITEAMTVSHFDAADHLLWSLRLQKETG